MSGNGNDRLTPFSSNQEGNPPTTGATSTSTSKKYLATAVAATFLLIVSSAVGFSFLNRREEGALDDENLHNSTTPMPTQSPFHDQLSNTPTTPTTEMPTGSPAYRATLPPFLTGPKSTQQPSTQAPTKKPTTSRPTKKGQRTTLYPTKKSTNAPTKQPSQPPTEAGPYYNPTIVLSQYDPKLIKAFEEAIKVLQQVVVGGREKQTRSTNDFTASVVCAYPVGPSGSPYEPRYYEDSIVYVVTANVDGENNILASAKVCSEKNKIYLIRFDNADLEDMLKNEKLAVQIITHELIHNTLGFYNLGDVRNLPLAQQAYKNLGHNDPLKLHSDRSHWSPENSGEILEDLLQPYLNTKGMQLTKPTLAALQDLNWKINETAAEVINSIYYSNDANRRLLEGIGWNVDDHGQLYFARTGADGGEQILLKINDDSPELDNNNNSSPPKHKLR